MDFDVTLLKIIEDLVAPCEMDYLIEKKKTGTLVYNGDISFIISKGHERILHKIVGGKGNSRW